ncbi:hypothetical protein OAL01_03920 [Rubripirellula sp.]|nr:hypothetical protein [Rubripirellula sp.]
MAVDGRRAVGYHEIDSCSISQYRSLRYQSLQLELQAFDSADTNLRQLTTYDECFVKFKIQLVDGRLGDTPRFHRTRSQWLTHW